MIKPQNQKQINSEILVILAKQALANVPHWKTREQYGQGQWRAQFGTVRLSLPRQSGHSTAALQLMYEYPDSLLMVPDNTTKHYTRMQLREFTDDIDTINRIEQNTFVASSSLVYNIKPVRERPFIIFDGASRIMPKVKQEIRDSMYAEIIVELQ